MIRSPLSQFPWHDGVDLSLFGKIVRVLDGAFGPSFPQYRPSIRFCREQVQLAEGLRNIFSSRDVQ